MNVQTPVSADTFLERLKSRASTFWKGRGMILALIEGTGAKVCFIDGVHRCQWDYTAHSLTLDWLGSLCLDGPPLRLQLAPNLALAAPAVVRAAFPGCDIVVQPLWKLASTAPDYLEMCQKHESDVGIRISFEGSPPSKATISAQLLEHLILSSKDPLATMPSELAEQIRLNSPVLYRNLQVAHATFAPVQSKLYRLVDENPMYQCNACGHSWHFRDQRSETTSFGQISVWCPECAVLARQYE